MIPGGGVLQLSHEGKPRASGDDPAGKGMRANAPE